MNLNSHSCKGGSDERATGQGATDQRVTGQRATFGFGFGGLAIGDDSSINIPISRRWLFSQFENTKDYRLAQSPGDLSRFRNAHIVLEHPAPPAYVHFTAPAASRIPLAEGSIDKPAKMTRIEFPGGAAPASLRGAVPDIPAGLDPFRLSLMKREQKKHLPLDMHGNLTPPLFEALDRLERRP